MNAEIKIACYKETYNSLKKRRELKDFRYPIEKKHLDYSCVAGDTLISFRLRTDKDLLQLRAEKQYADNENDKHNAFVREVAERHTGFVGTAYDGMGILQMNVPFPNMADPDAKQLVLQKTEEFAEVVIQELADLNGYCERTDTETPVADSEMKPETSSSEAIEKSKQSSEKQETSAFSMIRDSIGDALDSAREEAPAAVEQKPEADPIFADTSYLDEVESPETTEFSEGADDIRTEGPEVPKIPNEMLCFYDDITKAFAQRKGQLDCREGLLEQQKKMIENDRLKISEEWERIESARKGLAEGKAKLKRDWDSYSNAKKKLDERISIAAKKDHASTSKELELKKREQEIASREASAQAEEKVLKERQNTFDELTGFYERKKKEQEEAEKRLHAREEELTLKEKRLSIQEEQLRMEKKTIENRMSDLQEAQELYEDMKKQGISPNQEEKIKSLTAEVDSLKQKIQAAKQHISDIQASAKGHVEAENRAKEALKAVESRVAEAENTYETKIAASESEKERAQKQAEEWKQRVKELETIRKDSERVPAVEEVTKAGYTVRPIMGEGDPLLTFQLNGCDIIINERLSVVCIEKKTKRSHSKLFDEWNSQSFAETYCMSSGKAYCRFVYSDIITDIERVVTRLNTLK